MHNGPSSDVSVRPAAPDGNGRPACVLCLSGHDPSGGAGIHADIEAVAAQGAHALSVLTALTAQDTHDVRRVHAAPAVDMAAQIDLLLQDCRIAAIKIGLLGHADQVPVIARFIDRSRVPVVLDPVLRAGGGAELVSDPLRTALLEVLLPRVDLLTPNAAEARSLADRADLDAAGQALLEFGARNVLVTGGDEPSTEVVNTWFIPGHAPRRFTHARLPGRFHGAGCTLAAALAANLALGHTMAAAIDNAQRYTHQALQRARRIGGGRLIPGRLP